VDGGRGFPPAPIPTTRPGDATIRRGLPPRKVPTENGMPLVRPRMISRRVSAKHSRGHRRTCTGSGYRASSFMAPASAVSRLVIPPDSWVVRSTRTVR